MVTSQLSGNIQISRVITQVGSCDLAARQIFLKSTEENTQAINSLKTALVGLNQARGNTTVHIISGMHWKKKESWQLEQGHSCWRRVIEVFFSWNLFSVLVMSAHFGLLLLQAVGYFYGISVLLPLLSISEAVLYFWCECHPSSSFGPWSHKQNCGISKTNIDDKHM